MKAGCAGHAPFPFLAVITQPFLALITQPFLALVTQRASAQVAAGLDDCADERELARDDLEASPPPVLTRRAASLPPY